MSNENKREFKGLNIENLFSSKGTMPHTNGKLDINTLFNKTSNDNYSFDSDILLNGVRKRKHKLTETYADIYKGCCELITTASNTGATDIYYDAPDHVIDCTDYDSLECLKHIKDKLLEQNISTVILSRKKIFITWYDLEEKNIRREEELQKIENIDTTGNFTNSSLNDNTYY